MTLKLTMMQTLTIKVNDPHAYRMLEELEALRLIEVVRESAQSTKKTLSERLAGSITRDLANQMRDDLKQSRDEWERNF